MAGKKKILVIGVVMLTLAAVLASGCGRLRQMEQAAESQSSVSDRVALLEQEVADLQVALNQVQATNASAGAEAGVQDATEQASADDGLAVNAGEAAIAVVAGTPGYLNVRQEPDTNATQVGALVEGTEVSVLQVQDGWTKIQFRDKLTGWVASDYLQQKD